MAAAEYQSGADARSRVREYGDAGGRVDLVSHDDVDAWDRYRFGPAAGADPAGQRQLTADVAAESKVLDRGLGGRRMESASALSGGQDRHPHRAGRHPWVWSV